MSIFELDIRQSWTNQTQTQMFLTMDNESPIY